MGEGEGGGGQKIFPPHPVPSPNQMIDKIIKFWLDVSGQAVEVLAIIPKSKATAWLQEMGDRK